MNGAIEDRLKRDRDAASWRDQVPTMIAVAIIGAIVAGGSALSGKALQTGTTAEVLIARLELFQKTQETQESLTRDLIKSQSTFYTREDARIDRVANEQWRASIESKIVDLAKQSGDTNRRLETVEANQKMQQFVIDKFIAGQRR